MEFTQDNLTDKQRDYAIFLPAISSFYSGYVGRQRHNVGIESARIPQGLANPTNNLESMNWLNPVEGLFPYKWSLYSAGHANLDVSKFDPKEDMIRARDPNAVIVLDSGGFQIAKGVWPGKWADPTDKAAEKKREQVLKWQCTTGTYGMTMDIPTWTFRDPKAAAAAGIYSYDDAVTATKYNNDYWMANRTGDMKVLNVLQGGNHSEADHWYDLMKDYCNPAKHTRPFNGWGMGGQNMCDLELVLKRVVTLIHDGLLEQGQHDWMHFLGTSKLEWALVLTDIQRAVRQYHNPNFTISFDCASPFLATANGQLYHSILTEHRSKWSYSMSPTADNKKYATDSRTFGDAVRQDKIHVNFEDSPLSNKLKISDVCYYKPGDLNKIGKEGRTSWDSFSYALLMGHNVWMHIEAVQRANRLYDQGNGPDMLLNQFDPSKNVRNLIEQIFAAKDRKKSLTIIENNSTIWERVIGTRGFTGKKALNSHSQYNALFDVCEDEPITDDSLNEQLLEELENTL